METLDPFRADLLSLAERNARIGAPTDDDDFVGGIIPGKYLDRCIATFTVAPGQQWLDVRSPETHAVLRRELASELRKLSSIPRFVLGDLFSHDHGVTRMVAGWAIDHGFHGVAYASCHDISLTCWAIFEGAEITPLDSPKRVDRDDPDLLAVAQMWNLQIPTGNPASRFD